ncbi:unnamed protein product, partial [Linum tenue]
VAKPLSTEGEIAAALNHLHRSNPLLLLASLIDRHSPPKFDTSKPPFTSLSRAQKHHLPIARHKKRSAIDLSSLPRALRRRRGDPPGRYAGTDRIATAEGRGIGSERGLPARPSGEVQGWAAVRFGDPRDDRGSTAGEADGGEGDWGLVGAHVHVVLDAEAGCAPRGGFGSEEGREELVRAEWFSGGGGDGEGVRNGTTTR